MATTTVVADAKAEEEKCEQCQWPSNKVLSLFGGRALFVLWSVYMIWCWLLWWQRGQSYTWLAALASFMASLLLALGLWGDTFHYFLHGGICHCHRGSWKKLSQAWLVQLSRGGGRILQLRHGSFFRRSFVLEPDPKSPMGFRTSKIWRIWTWNGKPVRLWGKDWTTALEITNCYSFLIELVAKEPNGNLPGFLVSAQDALKGRDHLSAQLAESRRMHELAAGELLRANEELGELRSKHERFLREYRLQRQDFKCLLNGACEAMELGERQRRARRRSPLAAAIRRPINHALKMINEQGVSADMLLKSVVDARTMPDAGPIEAELPLDEVLVLFRDELPKAAQEP